MAEIDARLREDVHLLGELLGNTIRAQQGEAFLDKIERIRKGAKAARKGSRQGEQQLNGRSTGSRPTNCCRWPVPSTSSSTWPTSPSSTTASAGVGRRNPNSSRTACCPSCCSAWAPPAIRRSSWRGRWRGWTSSWC